MKRILVVAECLNKDKTSEGISTTNFLNALAKGPWKVECVYFQHVQHEISDTEHIDDQIRLFKIKNNWIDHLIQPSRILRRKIAIYFGINLLRARRAARFMKFLKPLIQQKMYDVVFVRTIAGSIASQTAVNSLSKQLDFNWIVNFNDPVPVSLMPYPYFNGNVRFPKQMQRDEALVKEIVKNCNGITSPSVLLTQRFLDFAGISAEAKNVYQFPHIYIKPKEIITPSFLDPAKLNIVHAGSLLKERNPEFLLQAFSRFIKEYPEESHDVRLTFFGNIHQVHLVRFNTFPFPEHLDVRNERLPHAEALGVLAESDVLIILEAIAEESPFMPGKLAEFIGLNKVIWALSPGKSETRRILGSTYPYQCEADSVNIMKSHFLSFTRNRIEINHNGLQKLNSHLNKYVSEDHIVEEMSTVISDLK